MGEGTMKKYVLSIGCCFLFFSCIIQSQEYDEYVLFVRKAIERFEELNVPEEEIRLLRQNLDICISAYLDEEKWIKLSEEVYLISKRNEIKSKVTIFTIPEDKATIKYQTVEQRVKEEHPTTAKELTTCVEEMNYGYYYIWSERYGEVTSDINSKYKIINDKEKVEIEEIDNDRLRRHITDSHFWKKQIQ